MIQYFNVVRAVLFSRIEAPNAATREPLTGSTACALDICCENFDDDVEVLLEHVLTRAVVARHPSCLSQDE